VTSVLKNNGMTKQLSLNAVCKLFFMKVEKVDEGWRTVVFTLDQQELACRLREVAIACEKQGLVISQQQVNDIRTDWIYNQSRAGFPQFVVKARDSISSKCVALAMLMYGSKPSQSYTWDCMKKANVKLLDRVSGICGENTMYMCREVSGLRIPFSLPAPGKIPMFMHKIIAKFCPNTERGRCIVCNKKSSPGVVFGRTYPCGRFVHDACFLEFHFSNNDNRAKRWIVNVLVGALMSMNPHILCLPLCGLP